MVRAFIVPVAWMLLSSFVLLEEDFLQVPIEDETLVAHRLSVESITFQKYTWPFWLFISNGFFVN